MPRLLILYGSQTGTAQDVAEQIWRCSKAWGFNGPVLSFEDYALEKLTEERLVVFVVATTGDGDPPDGMKQAWRMLLRRSLPADLLNGLQFACLGLGDSSYGKFNYAAKKLSKRLQNLGAQLLCPVGLGDDQHDHGHLATSMPWTDALFSKLSALCAVQRKDVSNPMLYKWHLKELPLSDKPVEVSHLEWSQKTKPLKLNLIENTRTTAQDHFQDVRLLRFDSEDETLDWQPGDILDLQPYNSDEDISAFFSLLEEHQLDFNKQTLVKLSSVYEDMPVPKAYSQPISLDQAAKYVWDLSAKPRQRFFEVLAQQCDDELEKEKLLEFCTSEGLNELIAYVNRPRRTLLEVLQDFRHATSKLTLEKLFEMMPLIQPRSFSIASDASSGSLDLLVAVVQYKTNLQAPRLGLCSNWLKALPAGFQLFGLIKPGTMSLPKELSTPLIMIGPGTGIAPFRSVIQNRLLAQKAGQVVGKLIVFFGCRNRTKDFHFAADFEAWSSTDIVQSFFAFSRDEDHKVYVQHVIKQHAALLANLLKEHNAHIYVAGSSNNMPKSVREAFVDVLDGDKNYLEQMLNSKRYQEETWS